MPRFNMNWIYLLVILALTFLYFSNGATGIQQPQTAQKEVSYSEFQELLAKGNASNIVVNKTKNTLKMYVKPDSIRSVFHKGTDQVGTSPYLSVEFGSVEKVEKIVETARADSVFTGELTYEREKEGGGYDRPDEGEAQAVCLARA